MFNSVRRPFALTLALLSVAVLTACSSLGNMGTSASTLGGLITPYRIDLLQGNVVVREQVQALQTGMPREQVRNVLGTPLVASVFHENRWDYVFTFNRQGQPAQMRRVSVFFEGDALKRVEADDLPSEEEFVASLEVRRSMPRTPALEATPEQLQAFRNQNPPTASTPSPAPLPAPGNYPPLETR